MFHVVAHICGHCLLSLAWLLYNFRLHSPISLTLFSFSTIPFSNNTFIFVWYKMKGALDPEYTDWVDKVGREGAVLTGVASTAVTLPLVLTIIPILDVFFCATTLDGSDCFRADKSDRGQALLLTR